MTVQVRHSGRILIAAVILSVVALPSFADDEVSEIDELKATIAKLEKRVAALEKVSRAALSEDDTVEARKEQQVAARKRMTHDRRKYTGEQLAEAEQLYQVANKNWRSPEAKQNLQTMIAKFPDINRTGCAIVYLAQMSEGPEKVRLLEDAIQNYGDCYYGDGVQVASFARFLLALYYREAGDDDKAGRLIKELKRDYPRAVDHDGEFLLSKLAVGP